MNTVKDILIKAILEDINGEIDIEIYNLPKIVINWPVVSEPDSFDDGEDSFEALDLENWEIISISDDKMIMCAGGDWQEPLTFSLVKSDENSLMATDIHEGYEDGMSYNDVIKALTK